VNTTRRSNKLLATAAATALVLAACGGSDDDASLDDTDSATETDTGDTGGGEGDTGDEAEGDTGTEADPEPAGDDGGTLIWAHEQEPPDLHLDDPENNLTITSNIRAALIEGLFGISGATEFYPELLESDIEFVESGDGFTVDYKLRDGLMWSDGTPLTTADVEFTYNVIQAADGETEDGDPNYIYLLGDRSAYAGITSLTVNSETEFTFELEQFNAGLRNALSEIYPAHQFDADPAAAAAELNDGLREWTTPSGDTMASSGPMLFESWDRGTQLNMVRNDSYHGSISPDASNDGVAMIDGVQINFVTDTDAQINALQAKEAQIIFTQPQQAFEDLASDDEFTVASSAGPVFEHWGLNLNNVHLAKPEVREALAFAMDKSQVMAGLYTPIFGDTLPAEGLGNTYWLSNQSNYENHAGDAGYGAGDVDSARAALESVGYVDDGGVYTHPEDGALTLRVGTTGGNRLREVQQELIQAQMGQAGIDIVIDNVEGGAYFDIPFGADHILCATSGGAEGNCDTFEITQFAWVGGPWPGGQTTAYRTGSENNTYGFQNAEFDALTDTCDSTPDDAERAACYNTADRYVTTLELDPENGLFMLPITQKPTFFGFTDDLATAGVAPDAQGAGPLTNVVDYSFAG